MAKPTATCPACGKQTKEFQWSGPGGRPITIHCPSCEWVWSMLPLELADGPAPWNTHGHPQARLARDWFENWAPNREQAKSTMQQEAEEGIVLELVQPAPLTRLQEGQLVDCQPAMEYRARWAVGQIVSIQAAEGSDTPVFTVEVIDPCKSKATSGQRIVMYEHWLKALSA